MQKQVDSAKMSVVKDKRSYTHMTIYAMVTLSDSWI